MIVGADVSHTGKGRDATCPSMAGVVATCDQLCSKYFASARLQENNTEASGIFHIYLCSWALI